MKNMKLIMENFRKNMQEARFGDPDFVPGRNPDFDYEKNKPKPARNPKERTRSAQAAVRTTLKENLSDILADQSLFSDSDYSSN